MLDQLLVGTYSSYACAEVPYDYDVEPSVNVNSDYINAESATSVDGIKCWFK